MIYLFSSIDFNLFESLYLKYIAYRHHKIGFLKKKKKILTLGHAYGF